MNEHMGSAALPSDDPDAIQADIEATRQRIDQTVASLERKMTPGQIVDEAVRFMGGAKAPSTDSIMNRVSANPLAAGMLALGAIWLMRSDQGQGSRPLFDTSRLLNAGRERLMPGRPMHDPRDWDDTRSRHWDDTRSRGWDDAGSRDHGSARAAVADAAGSVKDKVADTVDKARDVVSGTADKARDAMSDTAGKVRDTVSETADKARDAMSDTAGKVREAVSDTAGKVRDAVQDATGSAREAIDDARDSVGSAYRQARESVESIGTQASRFVQDQPLVLAGIGLAVGAAVGAMLPVSDRERQMLGDAGESLRDKATEVLDTVKQSALDATHGAVSKLGSDLKETAADVSNAGNAADQRSGAAGQSASTGQSGPGSVQSPANRPVAGSQSASAGASMPGSQPASGNPSTGGQRIG